MKIKASYVVGGVLLLIALSSKAKGEVPIKRTALTRKQATAYLTDALTVVLNRKPVQSEIKMIVAHSDKETGAWQSMYNYNFGNAQVSGKSGEWASIIDNNNPRKLKSFSNATVGALYFVNMLKTRFPKAWSVFGTGNPIMYAQALKEQGYFEAPLDSYARDLSARYERA